MDNYVKFKWIIFAEIWAEYILLGKICHTQTSEVFKTSEVLPPLKF